MDHNTTYVCEDNTDIGTDLFLTIHLQIGYFGFG